MHDFGRIYRIESYAQIPDHHWFGQQALLKTKLLSIFWIVKNIATDDVIFTSIA